LVRLSPAAPLEIPHPNNVLCDRRVSLAGLNAPAAASAAAAAAAAAAPFATGLLIGDDARAVDAVSPSLGTLGGCFTGLVHDPVPKPPTRGACMALTAAAAASAAAAAAASAASPEDPEDPAEVGRTE